MGENDPQAHNTSGIRPLSFSSNFLLSLSVGSLYSLSSRSCAGWRALLSPFGWAACLSSTVVMSVRWRKWGDGDVEDGRAMTTRRSKVVAFVVSCDANAGRDK